MNRHTRTSSVCRTWILAAAVALMGLSTSAVAAPSAQPAAAPVSNESPQAFVERMHKQLDGLVAKHKQLAGLHDAIGTQFVDRFDFLYMGQRVLGDKTWKGLKDAQRDEFLELLEKMLRRTYVKRFKPGHKVHVSYAKVRKGKEGRVQVRTKIKVKRTRADVWYSLRPSENGWRIFDIVVDEASQLRTYRRSFRKALKKDGWEGLIARMKKSASRG